MEYDSNVKNRRGSQVKWFRNDILLPWIIRGGEMGKQSVFRVMKKVCLKGNTGVSENMFTNDQALVGVTELTTMCALLSDDQVLMINRTQSWTGWAFPGGHLEDGESIEDCVVREMHEETGLYINNPVFCGITHIFNPYRKKRHIVFNFISKEFSGKLKDYCLEGKLAWVSVGDIMNYDLAEGMEYRLPMFFESKYSELYIEWKEEIGYTKVNYIR